MGEVDDDRGKYDEPRHRPLVQARTYVVRSWLEPRADGPPQLRGIVEELGGRTLGAFDSIERLATLVGRIDGAALPPPSLLMMNPEDNDA